MKKRNLTILGLIGLLALGGIGAGGTLSYFTQKESVTNVFTVGDLEIGLKEPEWNPEDGDGKDIYPGYTVYKNPTVKNTADEQGKTQPCYLMMTVRVLDASGVQVTDKNRLDLIKKTIRYDKSYNGSWEKTGTAQGLVQGRVPGYTEKEIEAFPMINPDFEELAEKDGAWVFAYKGGKDQILNEGEEAVLFTDVAVPLEWTGKELDLCGEFQLEISAAAIQASGFKNRDEAFAALEAE